MGERAGKKSSIGLSFSAKEKGKKWCKPLQEEDPWPSVDKESRRGLEVLWSATFIWPAGPGAQQERQGKAAGEAASGTLPWPCPSNEICLLEPAGGTKKSKFILLQTPLPPQSSMSPSPHSPFLCSGGLWATATLWYPEISQACCPLTSALHPLPASHFLSHPSAPFFALHHLP